jgi:hypothetical protein
MIISHHEERADERGRLELRVEEILQ